MKTEERCKRFSQILKDLVEISGDAQIERREAQSSLDIKSWLKEFCTIKLAGPRATGHTTAALQLIHDKFNKCMFVSPTKSMERLVREKSHKMKIEDKIRFIGFEHGMNDGRGDGGDYDAIIVDCAYFVSQKTLERIYSVFSPVIAYNNKLRGYYKPFFFIFLQ